MGRHLFALALFATVLASHCKAADGLPNIVILYADDMGFGDLAAQNPDSKIPTPHLDQLAREGLRLTDAHSSSGICTPSRYALLTGEYHWRKFHNIVVSFGDSKFADEQLTLPEMLRARGYNTACIGKWHLGWDWASLLQPGVERASPNNRRPQYAPDAFDWTKPIPDGPLAHGFDYYFGDDVPNFPPYTWIENDRVLMEPTEALVATPPTAEGAWEARPGPMASGWKLDKVMPTLTEKTVEWIRQRADDEEPFFLYFPFTSPHAPIVPVDPFIGSTKAGGYGDFVAQTDWTVGQVLQALEEHGFDENTIVIFTADNGPERYAYDRVRNHNHRSMGPLRGLKRDIWEGGHRVPTIVRWPNHVKAGSVSGALFGQIDIFSTLAEIVKFELPEGAASDSVSQLPVLVGQEPSVRRTLVHNTRANEYAIRHDDWVLIDAPTGGISRVPDWFEEQNGYAQQPKGPALYNLSRDLAQTTNEIETYPEIAKDLRAKLAVIRGDSASP